MAAGAAAAVATIALVGCGSAPNSPTAVGHPPSAHARPVTIASLTAKLRAKVPEIKKVTKISERNDPNDLIGRPNGYRAAEVLFDSRVSCSSKIGADCGAMIERWPSPAAAKARMHYIQRILKAAPMLGSEYDHPVGDLLVRVAGALKPSQARVYAVAIQAAS